MFAITKNETYAEVAAAAVQYEASVVLDNGEVPYILDGVSDAPTNQHVLEGIEGRPCPPYYCVQCSDTHIHIMLECARTLMGCFAHPLSFVRCSNMHFDLPECARGH